MPTSAIGSIIRAATRGDQPLNIMTFSTHEAYQSHFARLPHTFYLYEPPGAKTWKEDYRPLPPNHVVIKGALPPNVDLDLVWCQEQSVQFPLAQQISDELQLPLVNIEHTLPPPGTTDGFLLGLKESRKKSIDVPVFISEYSRRKWLWEDEDALIVHHGIDTEVFCPPTDETSRGGHLLSVVNDWKNRDVFCGYNYWLRATKGLPVHVLGDNPGLSRAASNVYELAHAYRSARIFVNTSLVSPVPTALLEAMASGCAVVSTATCMIPEVIESGVNGLLCHSPSEMRETLVNLLEDTELCVRLGQAARQTILKKFSREEFLQRWDMIFKYAVAQFTPGVNT